MMNVKSSKLKSLRLLLTLGIVLVLAITAVGIYVGVAQSGNKDLRDDFVIPTGRVENTYVGVKTPIARVMPTDTRAELYSFGVIDTATGKQVETDGYNFVPKKAGAYKCIFAYYVGEDRMTYSYDVTATVKDGPVFESEPALPTAFVSGSAYTLPKTVAKDFTDGEKDLAVEVTAKYGSGSPVALGGTFTPDISSGSEVTLEFKATSGGKNVSFVKTVPVVKAFNENGSVNTENLFITRGVSSKAFVEKSDEKRLRFSAMGDAEIKFANSLVGNGLELELGFGDNVHAEGLLVTVESVADPSVKLTLEFRKGRIAAGTGKIVLNGKNEKTFEYQEDGRLYMSVNTIDKRLVGEGGNLLFDIKEDVLGGEFNGFPGGLVRVSFELKGVYGTADMDLFRINRQLFNEPEFDLIAPTLFTNDISGEYSVGDTIVTSRAIAVDVLDPVATVTVSVTLDGETVNDINGNPLRRVDCSNGIAFKPTESGYYMVTYNVLDSSGNTSSANHKIIDVYDVEAPVIADADVPSSVKAGESFTMPEFTATDNDGAENVTVSVAILYPTAEMYTVVIGKGKTEATSVKLNNAGKYTVKVYAVDEWGNTAVKLYDLEVRGE